MTKLYIYNQSHAVLTPIKAPQIEQECATSFTESNHTKGKQSMQLTYAQFPHLLRAFVKTSLLH